MNRYKVVKFDNGKFGVRDTLYRMTVAAGMSKAQAETAREEYRLRPVEVEIEEWEKMRPVAVITYRGSENTYFSHNGRNYFVKTNH